MYRLVLIRGELGRACQMVRKGGERRKGRKKKRGYFGFLKLSAKKRKGRVRRGGCRGVCMGGKRKKKRERQSRHRPLSQHQRFSYAYAEKGGGKKKNVTLRHPTARLQRLTKGGGEREEKREGLLNISCFFMTQGKEKRGGGKETRLDNPKKKGRRGEEICNKSSSGTLNIIDSGTREGGKADVSAVGALAACQMVRTGDGFLIQEREGRTPPATVEEGPSNSAHRKREGRGAYSLLFCKWGGENTYKG